MTGAALGSIMPTIITAHIATSIARWPASQAGGAMPGILVAIGAAISRAIRAR